MAHDVFISYSDKNAKTAEVVREALESSGVMCWIASRDITGGVYAGAIVRAIKASRAMVLILSSHANESRHVLSEVDCAFNDDIPIYPLRVENVPLSEELKYYIGSAHRYDALEPPIERHIERLARDIKNLLSTSPANPLTSFKALTVRSPYKYHAFISYGAADKRWAEMLHRDLTARGFEIFFNRSILVGEPWEQQLDDSLDVSQHILILWSKNSAQSNYVNYERTYFNLKARDSKPDFNKPPRREIVILLDDSPAVIRNTLQMIPELKDDGTLAKGLDNLDLSVWGRVIDKVSEALSDKPPPPSPFTNFD